MILSVFLHLPAECFNIYMTKDALALVILGKVDIWRFLIAPRITCALFCFVFDLVIFFHFLNLFL